MTKGEKLRAKRREMAERALVMWDALEDRRAMSMTERYEVIDLAAYAGARALATIHEPKGRTTKRQRRFLAQGGVRWVSISIVLTSPSGASGRLQRDGELLCRVPELKHRVPLASWPKSFSMTFLGCAFCGFLLLPCRTSRYGGASFTWNAWRLAVARAHTTRCALRYLIDRATGGQP